MSLFLQRIDAVPLKGNESFTFEFQRWLSTLVDTMNTTIDQLEDLTIDWNDVIETSQVVTVDSAYINTNVALTTFTLPDECTTGSRVIIAGQGAGGWTLVPGMGQTIEVIDQTAATSISSAERYDSIEIVCIVENTQWSTLSTQTTGFIII